MSNPPPSTPPQEPPSPPRLRWLALGALVFLLLEFGLLMILPQDDSKKQLRALVVADVALAATVCGVLLFSLRKRGR